MRKANQVKNNIVSSFFHVKSDMNKLAVWIAWNKREHDILKERLEKLEKLQHSQKTYVASAKGRKVHLLKSAHAKRIKETDRQYFEMLRDAEACGYSICECAA